MKDMPEPIVTEPDAGAFFDGFVSFLDITGHCADGLGSFREDHAAREDFEGQGLSRARRAGRRPIISGLCRGPIFRCRPAGTILFKNAADHGAKPIAPAAVSVV